MARIHGKLIAFKIPSAIRAPFGYSKNSEKAKILVAIRNIQAENGEYILGTGCGVVKESELDREWAELFLKRDSVRRDA